MGLQERRDAGGEGVREGESDEVSRCIVWPIHRYTS